MILNELYRLLSEAPIPPEPDEILDDLSSVPLNRLIQLRNLLAGSTELVAIEIEYRMKLEKLRKETGGK